MNRSNVVEDKTPRADASGLTPDAASGSLPPCDSGSLPPCGGGLGWGVSSADSRILRATEEYAALVHAGETPDREIFLARYADIADELGRCLDSLDFLDAARRSLGGAMNALPAEHDLLASAQPLGDYRLIREVGHGGMGIVYEAEQLSLGRRVALKVLPFAATMDPKQLQRFRNEALAAASLRHDHIVHVYGVGCERGVHFYAMEFIDGQTLAEVIHQASRERDLSSRERERPESEAATPVAHAPGSTGPVAALSTKRDKSYFRSVAALIADAAEALDHAHELGVVHRDIKPGNLMLDESGRIWITDFGLAKVVVSLRDTDPRSRATRLPDLTLTGDVIGTLRYMAPEQALAKHGLVDHRADIYSLGATLYELLTLHPAVRGDDKAEILNAIAWDEPTPLCKLDKSIPVELETITLKCLAKEPGERYATAGEMAADLRRWLSDLAIQAKPPGWRERAAKWGRRHKALVGALLVILTLGVAGLTVSNVLIGHARNDAIAALTRARQDRARARQVVEDLWVGVVEKWLRDEPALEQTQKQFAEKILDYCEGLARDEADNPELKAEVGKAHYRMAVIHDRLGALNQGSAAYRRATEVFNQLALQSPSNPEHRYWEARSMSEHADLLDRLGQGLEAEQKCERAGKLLETAAAEFPSDQRIQAGLADCCAFLGTVNYQPGPRVNLFYLDHPEVAPKRGWKNCVKNLERALAIYPKVIASGPATSEPLWRYHRAQKILSQMPKLTFAERERLMTESLAGFKALMQEYPRDYRPKVEFCEAQSWWGMLLWSSGQPELAEKALRQAYADADRLVVEFPKTLYYPKLRASCATTLGMFLATTDRNTEGEPLLKQAIDDLLKVPPGLVPRNEPKREAARAWEILALSHLCQEKFPEADHAYSEAFRIYAQLFREAPSRATFGSFVDICYFHSLSRIRAGRLADADELVLDAISTTQQVAAAPGADPRITKFEGGVLNVQGSLLQRLDRPLDSDRAFEKSVEIYAKLDECYPNDEPGFRGAYTGIQANRAINRRSSGQMDRCFELLRQRIEWLDRRAATNDAIAKHYRELAIECRRFDAQELDFVNRLSESAQAYRDVMDRIQRLAAESPGRSESNRDRAACLMALAHVLQRANNEPEAIQAADQSMAIRRKFADSSDKDDRRALAFEQLERASIEARAGRVKDAIALLDDSVAKLGQLVAKSTQQGAAKRNLQFAHAQRGWLLERVGRPDEAETTYRQALNLAQETVGDFARGEAKTQTPWFGSPPWYDGQVERECLAQTNLTFCHRVLARFYARRGQVENAKRYVENEQKIWGDLAGRYPASAFAACNLAWCLVSGPVESLRDPDRALRLASRAVATDENYLTVATLGAAKYRTGDFQGAVACLELQPRLPFGRRRPDDLLFLAMARWRIGDQAGAQRDYQEAMRLAAMRRFEHVWDLVEQLRQEFETVKAQP